MNPPPDLHQELQRWLVRLEQLHPSEIELGLDRVLVVFRRLLPRNWSPRVTTVAGTNGKGSTVRALEGLLLDQERTVGAYFSPHINRFNERIHLNGEDVTDYALLEAFEAVESARKDTSLTYFEFTTLAALWLFHRHNVQDLVLEVGLGGRLDAVNIMDPHLAIITNIDLDHTDWLGDNREAIGAEKAGILRPGIRAIYGESDPPLSVLRQAQAQSVSLRVAGIDFDSEDGQIRLNTRNDQALTLRWPDEDVPSPAQLMALEAMALLGMTPDQSMVESVRRSAPLPGRFERLGTEPAVIADVGHNPSAARWLARSVTAQIAPGARVRAVYGALADKDAPGVMEALAEVVDHWYLATLTGSRGRTAGELSQLLSGVGPSVDQAVFDTPAEALKQAMADAAKDDLVLVFGSFLMVAEARDYLRQDDGS